MKPPRPIFEPDEFSIYLLKKSLYIYKTKVKTTPKKWNYLHRNVKISHSVPVKCLDYVQDPFIAANMYTWIS